MSRGVALIYASGGTDGAGVGAGRGSLDGDVRVLPLLADDAAGGVDCFAGAVADLVELDDGADGLRVALSWLFGSPARLERGVFAAVPFGLLSLVLMVVWLPSRPV